MTYVSRTARRFVKVPSESTHLDGVLRRLVARDLLLLLLLARLARLAAVPEALRARLELGRVRHVLVLVLGGGRRRGRRRLALVAAALGR